jgi:hypothetical protein
MSIALIWMALNYGFEGPDGPKLCKRIVVCCPTSLVFNWNNEIDKVPMAFLPRWCPLRPFFLVLFLMLSAAAIHTNCSRLLVVLFTFSFFCDRIWSGQWYSFAVAKRTDQVHCCRQHRIVSAAGYYGFHLPKTVRPCARRVVRNLSKLQRLPLRGGQG